MGAIPDQLSARLPDGLIHLDTEVIGVAPGEVSLAGGRTIQCDTSGRGGRRPACGVAARTATSRSRIRRRASGSRPTPHRSPIATSCSTARVPVRRSTPSVMTQRRSRVRPARLGSDRSRLPRRRRSGHRAGSAGPTPTHVGAAVDALAAPPHRCDRPWPTPPTSPVLSRSNGSISATACSCAATTATRRRSKAPSTRGDAAVKPSSPSLT